MDTWKTNWENWHLKDPGDPAARFVSMRTPWRRSEDWSFSCERWTDASAPRWGWAWGGNSRAPAIWLRVPMGYLWGTYGYLVLWLIAVIAISHIIPPCRIQHVSHGKNMVKNIRESDEIGRGPAAVLSHVKRHGSNHKHESGTLWYFKITMEHMHTYAT